MLHEYADELAPTADPSQPPTQTQPTIYSPHPNGPIASYKPRTTSGSRPEKPSPRTHTWPFINSLNSYTTSLTSVRRIKHHPTPLLPLTPQTPQKQTKPPHHKSHRHPHRHQPTSNPTTRGPHRTQPRTAQQHPTHHTTLMTPPTMTNRRPQLALTHLQPPTAHTLPGVPYTQQPLQPSSHLTSPNSRITHHNTPTRLQPGWPVRAARGNRCTHQPRNTPHGDRHLQRHSLHCHTHHLTRLP